MVSCEGFARLQSRWRSANLARRVGFRIEGLVLCRPSRQINHHDRVVAGAGLGRFGLQQTRQTEPSQTQTANAEEAAARHSVAELLLGPSDCEHGSGYEFLDRLFDRGSSLADTSIGSPGRRPLVELAGWKGSGVFFG